MRAWAVVLVVVLAGLAASCAGAYPTFGGVSGVVTMPTAEVAPEGQLALAADYLRFDTPGGMVTIWPLRLTAGLGSNLELAGNFTLVNDDADEENSAWVLGGKYALLTEEEDDVALALALSWQRTNNDVSNYSVAAAALALSKTLDMGVSGSSSVKAKGTVGLSYTSLTDCPYMDDTTSMRPYLALEVIGEKGVTLGLEYRWKDSDLDDKAPFSAVLRAPLSDTAPIWGQIGMTNTASFGALSDQDVFFGISYLFTSGN